MKATHRTKLKLWDAVVWAIMIVCALLTRRDRRRQDRLDRTLYSICPVCGRVSEEAS